MRADAGLSFTLTCGIKKAPANEPFAGGDLTIKLSFVNGEFLVDMHPLKFCYQIVHLAHASLVVFVQDRVRRSIVVIKKLSFVAGRLSNILTRP